MNFEQEVIEIIAEICQDDVVKENLDIKLFEEGLLDSFGTVEMLVEIENRLNIQVPITEFDREEWDTPNTIIKRLNELK